VVGNREIGERHHDTISDMEPLDNPVWHALTGAQARFAEGAGPARRYQTDVAAFSALPDEPETDAWAALADLVGPGGVAVLFRPSAVTLPADWELVTRMDSLQMVATTTIGKADDSGELTTLGAPDVDDMLALVERTKPGPFATRTVELGRYLGHRTSDGRLVAMTGERIHPPGYTELSAVCADTEARKRGLATRLVRAVAAGIEARGETPMLHVLAENHSAIRVYRALGFTTRAAFETLIVRAPA
jgi:ribosomal protein S18 acetylase RimI-like enzyme